MRIHVINIGSEMYFHFIRFFMKRVVCFFLFPSLFRFFLSHVKLVKNVRKNTDLSSFLTDFTAKKRAKRRSFTCASIDELRRLTDSL